MDKWALILRMIEGINTKLLDIRDELATKMDLGTLQKRMKEHEELLLLLLKNTESFYLCHPERPTGLCPP